MFNEASIWTSGLMATQPSLTSDQIPLHKRQDEQIYKWIPNRLPFSFMLFSRLVKYRNVIKSALAWSKFSSLNVTPSFSTHCNISCRTFCNSPFSSSALFASSTWKLFGTRAFRPDGFWVLNAIEHNLEIKMQLSYTSSFRSIISIKNSLFNSELSSGIVTPLRFSRYSARRIGDCTVLYALFMSELQSADRLCSSSLLEVINWTLSAWHRWASEH